jgi:integrase
VNLREHDGRDDMKVWLGDQEVEELLEVAADVDVEHYVAIGLGVRCGLRSAEVLNVTPRDVQDTTAGRMLRVPDGKGGKYRETPIPTTLATTISTIADVRDASTTEPLLDVTTRTLRRWVDAAALELAETTDDEGWRFLSFHDLRRTWATSLASSDVDPLVVLEWGGWADLETFLDHYQGAYSPEAQRRERRKVTWL